MGGCSSKPQTAEHDGVMEPPLQKQEEEEQQEATKNGNDKQLKEEEEGKEEVMGGNSLKATLQESKSTLKSLFLQQERDDEPQIVENVENLPKLHELLSHPLSVEKKDELISCKDIGSREADEEEAAAPEPGNITQGTISALISADLKTTVGVEDSTSKEKLSSGGGAEYKSNILEGCTGSGPAIIASHAEGLKAVIYQIDGHAEDLKAAADHNDDHSTQSNHFRVVADQTNYSTAHPENLKAVVEHVQHLEVAEEDHVYHCLAHLDDLEAVDNHADHAEHSTLVEVHEDHKDEHVADSDDLKAVVDECTALPDNLKAVVEHVEPLEAVEGDHAEHHLAIRTAHSDDLKAVVDEIEDCPTHLDNLKDVVEHAEHVEAVEEDHVEHHLAHLVDLEAEHSTVLEIHGDEVRHLNAWEVPVNHVELHEMYNSSNKEKAPDAPTEMLKSEVGHSPAAELLDSANQYFQADDHNSSEAPINLMVPAEGCIDLAKHVESSDVETSVLQNHLSHDNINLDRSSKTVESDYRHHEMTDIADEAIHYHPEACESDTGSLTMKTKPVVEHTASTSCAEKSMNEVVISECTHPTKDCGHNDLTSEMKQMKESASGYTLAASGPESSHDKTQADPEVTGKCGLDVDQEIELFTSAAALNSQHVEPDQVAALEDKVIAAGHTERLGTDQPITETSSAPQISSSHIEFLPVELERGVDDVITVESAAEETPRRLSSGGAFEDVEGKCCDCNITDNIYESAPENIAESGDENGHSNDERGHLNLPSTEVNGPKTGNKEGILLESHKQHKDSQHEFLDLNIWESRGDHLPAEGFDPEDKQDEATSTKREVGECHRLEQDGYPQFIDNAVCKGGNDEIASNPFEQGSMPEASYTASAESSKSKDVVMVPVEKKDLVEAAANTPCPIADESREDQATREHGSSVPLATSAVNAELEMKIAEDKDMLGASTDSQSVDTIKSLLSN